MNMDSSNNNNIVKNSKITKIQIKSSKESSNRGV